MKGFLYRLGTAIKEKGERLHIACLVIIGLKIRESIIGG
jgi:hypothetical protein